MGRAKKSEVILDHVAIRNRIVELGLKQWWLAEQIGVDRKTVGRWLHGSVRTVRLENAEALAQVLGCGLSDVTLEDEAERVATAEDQKAAAKALVSSTALLDKLGPIGEWPLIETLLRASIVPDLPSEVLGELYNRLTTACWRQSKIDQAETFNRKAEAIAREAGDKALLAGALGSKANILTWRGKTKSAIATYHECLELEKFLAPAVIGSLYSNLSAALYEAGDLAQGEEIQRKAIRVFQLHGKPMNLSIAYCHLARILLQAHRLQEARGACEKSMVFAGQDDYRRGIQIGKLVLAEIEARGGRVEDARRALREGLEGFKKLGIEEGLNYEFAGRVCRLLGDFEAADTHLNQGLLISKEFPVEEAGLHFERALLFNEWKPGSPEVLPSARKAYCLFRAIEADLRAKAVVETFGSSVISAP